MEPLCLSRERNCGIIQGMKKMIVLLLLSLLFLPCVGAGRKRVRQLKPIKPESVSVEWILHKHVQRVLRQDGSLILFPLEAEIGSYEII